MRQKLHNLDLNFLHYHDGSNHSNKPYQYHDNKFRIFKEFIDDILND